MARAPSGTKSLTGTGGNGHLVIPRPGGLWREFFLTVEHSKRAGPSQHLMGGIRDVLSNDCVFETPQSFTVSHCKCIKKIQGGAWNRWNPDGRVPDRDATQPRNRKDDRVGNNHAKDNLFSPGLRLRLWVVQVVLIYTKNSGPRRSGCSYGAVCETLNHTAGS